MKERLKNTEVEICFNGALLRGVGKALLCGDSLRFEDPLLQWGPTPGSREGEFSESTVNAPALLQWGPTPGSREGSGFRV